MLEAGNYFVGTCVLLTNPRKSYNLGPSNPAVGTKWECVGKIVRAIGGTIYIKWENGHSNNYFVDDLTVVSPEIGMCEDIWKQMVVERHKE